jgi:hypothetical protein
MKIRPVGTELSHVGRMGGQTDTTKLIVALRKFETECRSLVQEFPLLQNSKVNTVFTAHLYCTVLIHRMTAYISKRGERKLRKLNSACDIANNT